MSASRKTLVEDLFAKAIGVPSAERGDFLARACGDDLELRAELESLLGHFDKAGEHLMKLPDARRLLDADAALAGSSPPHDPQETRPVPGAGQVGGHGGVRDRAQADSPAEADDATLEAKPSIRGLAPDTIEGYSIIRELHRGGQGVVYQALQKSTKRKVAIKILLEGPYASKSARKRFEREIELVARLRHPCIVEVFHSGETADGRQYFVMDYVRGLPLDQYVKEKKLPLEEALQLFTKVCEAVNYAHQRGVIHRDLKPSNILIDSDGTPKVLDFGLAKQLAGPEESLMSVTGQVVGTLPYMSPEQAKGNPDEIDIRTDVYALGVILYEVLTGQYPYPVVGQMAEVLRHIAETPPTPPSRMWKSGSGIAQRSRKKLRLGACPIDDDVQTIVMKALAKERERRYQSAVELARDLIHYIAGEPIEAKRDSAFYVLRKLARHHAYATAVLLLVSCIMISSSVISYYFYRAECAEVARNESLAKQAHQQSRMFESLAAKAQDQVHRMTLGWFLLEWHADAGKLKKQNSDLTPQGSVEAKAMQFLLDSTYSEDRFLAELPADSKSLGYFVIGERHLNQSQPAKALQAYQTCLSFARDGWVRDTATARLEQLRKQADKNASPEAGIRGSTP